MNKTKINKVMVSGFRGSRYKIPLDFSSQQNSMLIYGANAKGKSSLGDAFEWFYTGKILELEKEGCSRVDYRHRLLSDDEDTIVGFKFSDPSLDSDFVLKSSIRQKHSNKTNEFKEYLNSSKDELLFLRHKNLKQFIVETKSYKRKHIAKLIGMEGWEKLRDDMGFAERHLLTSLEKKQESLSSRQTEVTQLIDKEKFSKGACWKFAEKQANVLGIKRKISNLDSLNKADAEAKATTQVTEREVKLNKLRHAEKFLKTLESDRPGTQSFIQFAEAFNGLCAQSEKVLWVQINNLHQQGKSILRSGYWSEDTCPLCGKSIPQAELMEHIQEHESKRKEIVQEVSEVEKTRSLAKKELEEITTLIGNINNLDVADVQDIEILKTSGSEVALQLAEAKPLVEKKLETYASIELKDLELDAKLNVLIKNAKNSLTAVQKSMQSLTPTAAEKKRIEAFQNLNTLSSHMTALGKMSAEIKPLELQVSSMRAFNKAFMDLRWKTMGDVLQTISVDVSHYFRKLHPKEGFDDIQLKFLPDVDGVEFHIYYKGEEITPPRKFLSESYLSGLGVCLFLATVRAFNKQNGFLLLDDIVNSFDAEHRSDLARLLVNEFKDFQLIVLTHDGFWFDFFRRLAQSGWQYRRINAWSYEDGMDIEVSPKDALDDCKLAIKSGKVDYAAPKVRSYMENRLKRLSFEIGVRVRFRPGSQNDVRVSGELLADMRSYIKRKGFFDKITSIPFNELGASTFVVNFGSHDRSLSPEAAGLVMGDVEFALERMLDLEELYYCPDCTKPIWEFRDNDFNMKCKCGNYVL